jgi:cytoskeletal protein RodZ
LQCYLGLKSPSSTQVHQPQVRQKLSGSTSSASNINTVHNTSSPQKLSVINSPQRITPIIPVNNTEEETIVSLKNEVNKRIRDPSSIEGLTFSLL